MMLIKKIKKFVVYPGGVYLRHVFLVYTFHISQMYQM